MSETIYPGDTVVCNDAANSPFFVGQLYKVVGNSAKVIWLDGFPEGYSVDRFTRYKQPEKTLDNAWDNPLPKPTRSAPPMPAIKPPKPESKFGKLSDSEILAAFNKLTGCTVSEDEYETLLKLQQMFDSRE